MDTDPIDTVNHLLALVEYIVDVNVLYYGFHLQNIENAILENYGLKTPMGDLSHLYQGD